MEEGTGMDRRLKEHKIELSLPNEIGYERIAMASLAAFAKMLGFDSDRIEDLKTAVSEACLNAIAHGNRGLNGAKVEVTFNFLNETLIINIKDEGGGIKKYPGVPNIDKKIHKEEPPNGLGLYLIEQLMDHVEYKKMTGKGHVVSMSMRLRH